MALAQDADDEEKKRREDQAKLDALDIGKRVKQVLEEQSYWEKCKVDTAYEEDAEAMVIKPSNTDMLPAPVLLFLLGQGQVDGRQPLEGFGLDMLVMNTMFSSRYTIIVPKPSTKSGLVRYTGEGWKKEWAHDAVWAMFTETLRRLGPGVVNPARLYCTGISMGAAGAWAMAIKYGEYFAAISPISGACNWPGDTWPRRSEPDPKCMERLKNLPFRAYQIDSDAYAGSPLRDIEYLTYGIEEKTKERVLDGLDPEVKINATIRTWTWEKKKNSAMMELYWVKGPIQDNMMFKDKDGSYSRDDHCLWLRVFSNNMWGLASFFCKTVPEERQWSFDSQPILLDTTADREALKAAWGDGPVEEKVGAPMKLTINSMEDLERMMPDIIFNTKEVMRDPKCKKVGVTVEFKTEDDPAAEGGSSGKWESPKEEPKQEESPQAQTNGVAKAPQVNVCVFWDHQDPRNKIDLKVKDGVRIDVLKFILAGGDWRKAEAFSLGLKKSDADYEKLPEDHVIGKDERSLHIMTW